MRDVVACRSLVVKNRYNNIFFSIHLTPVSTLFFNWVAVLITGPRINLVAGLPDVIAVSRARQHAASSVGVKVGDHRTGQNLPSC